MFKHTNPSLQGEVYSNMNLYVLELKLYEVQFADKFSEPSLQVQDNLLAKCTECSLNPNVNKEVAKYPNAEVFKRGVLSLP